ncbi:hypothetical protein ElyMa_004236500 [Elysia marginata]|uniref:Schwannomin interacting protein 1 C-terminal domain-containing protein n=1 Tax=Elysia marginata TaxID=1093978 RepID=A0AAV4GSU8_9GAST|nr:hypothetical protein ElyMa_004236500 [Elysia marginata]
MDRKRFVLILIASRLAHRRSCKNDREEIRRRLAMATDEEFGDDVSSSLNVSSNAGENQALLMSPRNKRLQARLQGATSGMQICFMNDDILTDDDNDDDAGYDGGNDYDDDLPTPRQGEEESRLLRGFPQSPTRLNFQCLPPWVAVSPTSSANV